MHIPSSKAARAFRLGTRKVAGLLVALVCLAVGPIWGSTPAQADTPQWSITEVWMNIGSAGPSQQSQYFSLINSLRNAAGHGWRNNMMATQTDGYHSLIRMNLNASNANLILWFTPNDLYLRGFTTTNGDTYAFSDFNLRNEMQPANWFTNSQLLPPAAWGNGNYYVLPFGSDYNDLVQAAGRGRERMPLSWNDFWNSQQNLAWAQGFYASDMQNYARSLMFMIQYTSEAARFYDVVGLMSTYMLSSAASSSGLPALQQEVENSWSQMSNFAVNSTNGHPGPLSAGPDVPTMYTFGDVASRLALRVGRTDGTVVSPTGDWWRSEL